MEHIRTPRSGLWRASFVVTSLALSSALAFGAAAESPVAARAADTSRFAGMPDPEAFAVPATKTASATADAYSLSPTTIRVRGTRRIFRINATTGTITRQRWVNFGLASTYRTPTQTSTFKGRQFAGLTSGTYAGWWVAAPDVVPTTSTGAPAAFPQPLQVKLSAGTRVGVRFYAKERVRTRRSLSLTTAALYPATAQATFNGKVFFLLSDGPLAGRWVARSSGVALAGQTSSVGPITPPAPTVPPAATWKGVVMIYRQTDVTFTRANGSSYRLRATMSNTMYDLVKSTMGQMQRSTRTWSDGYAALDLTFVDVPRPLSQVTPLGSAYWVDPGSLKADLDIYAPTGAYDSIFVIWEPRDSAGVEIPVGGWGLTLPSGPWSNMSGFSSIITPAQMSWLTNSTVPEEMFIHEWMHQVIYFHQTAGRMKLDLHADAKYGYVATSGSFKTWLSDVMRGRVQYDGALLGVSREIWAAGQPTTP